MWCLTLTDGTRTFHLSPEAAHASALGAEHVVWYDAFDYTRHNPEHSALRYAERVKAERETGLMHVTALCDGLRTRLGLVTP